MPGTSDPEKSGSERKVTVSDGSELLKAVAPNASIEFKENLPWFRDKIKYPRMQITGISRHVDIFSEPSLFTPGNNDHPLEVLIKTTNAMDDIKISEIKRNNTSVYNVLVDFNLDRWEPSIDNLKVFENESLTIQEIVITVYNQAPQTIPCNSSKPCAPVVIKWKKP